MKWPKSVPILTADDIYKGSCDGPNETHCLIGWGRSVFRSAEPRQECFLALREATGGRCVVIYNDAPRHSKSTLARVWNRAMAKLGYTEGNPEA